MSAPPRLAIELLHGPRLCYAMQQNAVPLLQLVRLRNETPHELRDVEVAVRLEPGIAEAWRARVASIPAGGTYNLVDVRLQPRPDALANATERQLAQLRAEAASGGEVLATAAADVEVLAYNEWPGSGSLPALLAAFVLPNHPALAPVLRAAAERLGHETGLAGLDGYQSREPERALAMARAVYEVLQGRGIVYASPPASFEQLGQKVRTPEQVLQEGIGTCLDLAALYAACLEQIGLHALLVVGSGHALAGVWLHDEVFPDPAPADPLPLRKRVELGRLALVECTTICATLDQPFEVALQTGARAVAADATFQFAVDVTAARRAGIRPLPIRTSTFQPELPIALPVGARAGDGDEEETPGAVTVPSHEPAGRAAQAAAEDRLARWQRRLLDLSLRNRLLNFVASKRTIPIAAASLAELQDALEGGAPFRLLPEPKLGLDAPPARTATGASDAKGADGADRAPGASGADGDRADAADVPSAPGEADPPGGDRNAAAEARARFLREELQSRRLFSPIAAEDLDRRQLEIWRQTRLGEEESGVSTLFLALGFLRWYETTAQKEPRRAPLFLLPLRLERISLAEGFVLHAADDEPRVNETLVQKLRHDFGIEVPAISRDEGEGGEREPLAVDAVLAAFRRAVLEVPRWEVETTASLGSFSFAKHLMWLDLEDRRDELLAHPFLHHLVATPGAAFEQAGDWPEPDRLDERDPAQVLCPKDADSSQLAAVLAAAEGRSFVLEGPPGTGKSQTITNLVAQCLANGKRVLFVAEKRAALEVVQRRLEDVGLAPFCLELHSGKGSKKEVVQQLGRAFELARAAEPQAWQQRAAELRELRDRLNAHVDAIHRERETGGSVFEAMATVVASRDLPMVDGLPADLDAGRLARCRAAVDALAATALPLGDPRALPWRGVRRTDWTPALGRELEPLLAELAAATDAARRGLAAAGAALGLAQAELADRHRHAAIVALGRLLAEGPLPRELLLAGDFATASAEVREWIEALRGRRERWQRLAPHWTPALLGLDVIALRTQLLRHERDFFLLRWWRLRPVRRALGGVGAGAAPRTGVDLHQDLATAAEVRDLDARLAAADAAARARFGSWWRGIETDPEQLLALLERTAVVRRACQELAADPTRAADLAAAAAEEAPAAAPLRDLLATAAALDHALAAAAAPLRLDLDRMLRGEDRERGFLPVVAERVAGFRAHPMQLRDHCALQRDLQSVEAEGIDALGRAFEDGEVDAARLRPVFERSFAATWLDAMIAHENSLAAFRGMDHQRAIERFRSIDRELIDLAGKVVLARLCAALPSLRTTTAESSELGVLLRELKKQRRHLAPRQLFARIPNLLSRLAPCLLMSPLTVAQVLGRGVPPFDVVVFDEASQVPVWDAVGAVGRGRSLVVVGDSRQLPPTAFFQRMEGDDEVRDDLEAVEELESVLDECAAAGLQRLDLRWHYRSRHESLIAFSNHHYYDNRLFTFPSPDGEASGLGVRLVHVDGVYDRSKSQTNRAEAEALVGELVRRLLDPVHGAFRYGVVTFSQAQQVLVEDLLEVARREHPAIERHFTGDEPVFVKNLENVQGDERDVMLFSICYGPDAAGRVHMNFGPLNQQGGERRLNVAVTRARRELLVFASLRAEQIDLARTQSLGVRHLRTFLDYAARGAAAIAEAVALDPSRDCESPFERQVRAALQQRGHEVHAQIGCSGYRIDLAVADPRLPGRYLLGIECDGRTYHSAATARDRDRLRQGVLERLGWTLCRVWSTDWWLDPAGECDRLDRAIAAALQRPFEAPPPPAAPEPVRLAASPAAPVAPVAPAAEADAAAGAAADAAAPGSDLPVYRPAALASRDADAFFTPRGLQALERQIRDVLAAEAPIVFDLLVRRIVDAWGLGRVTERVRDRVGGALHGDVVRGDHGALWPAGADPFAFTAFRVPRAGDDATMREADQLPAIEVANAMRWLLDQHGSLAESDLLREAARLFGWSRLGSAVRTGMQQGLDVLVARGRARIDGGVVLPG